MTSPPDAKPFEFLDPGDLADPPIRLELNETIPADPVRGLVPAYSFSMRVTGSRGTAGHLSLRASNNPTILLYAGHVGYGVDPEWRGNHFAARATRLIYPLARAHGLEELWITVNPENAASRRTCELLGGEMVEIVDLPPDCDMYQRGERRKCRYRIDLRETP